MNKDGYYTSGEFAKKAHVTKKTLRYYDEHRYLTPSCVDDNNFRLYSDQDFQKLQRILLLKYLGFSLDEIKKMTVKVSDDTSMLDSMKIQLSLLDERIEQMKVVKEIMLDTMQMLEKNEEVDWAALMESVSITGMENSLKQQYLNTSNILARINLHNLYSVNKRGWFDWIFDYFDLKEGMKVLELGSGSGRLWIDNMDKIPTKTDICLSDLSEGMVRELKRNVTDLKKRFSFEVIDMHNIEKEAESYDIVIANHVLFYSGDLEEVLNEIYRVLKPGGKLVAGTYGDRHMMEISNLVKEFDNRIVLSANKLSDVFGKENGKKILEQNFKQVSWEEYEDCLNIYEPEPLIDYIISCHGNQNQYIVDNYKDFYKFVTDKVNGGLTVTKEAGIFIAYK